MPTIDQLTKALMEADAAGDTEAATMFAEDIKKLKAGGSAPAAAPAVETAPVVDPEVARVKSEFDNLGFFPKSLQSLDDGMRLGGNLFGLTDKAVAKASSWWEGTPYEAELARQRKLTDEARIRSGVVGTGVEVAGDVASIAATGASSLIPKAATGLPKLAGVLGLTAAEGGAAGGLEAWGDDTDIGEGIAWGTGTGILGGAAGSALGKLGSNVLGYFKNTPIPGGDALKAVTDKMYEEVDKLGVKYSPDQIKRLAKKVVQALDKARLNPKIHPHTVAKAEELVADAKFGINKKQPMDLIELDEFRQFAMDDLGKNKQEMRMRKPMIQTIDDFIEKTNPAAGPFAADAHKGILAAREAAATAGKTQDIREAMGEAAFDANPVSAVRTKLKPFLKKRQRGRFEPEELKSIRDVVVPGGTEGFFDTMGKLGGFSGLGIGTTALSAGAAGSAIMQDPKYAAMGAAVPVLGMLGRNRAKSIQNKNIDKMLRTVTKTPQKFKLSGQTDAEMARILTMLGLELQE